MRHGVLDETFFTGMGKSCDFLVECAVFVNGRSKRRDAGACCGTVKGVESLGGGLHR